MPKFWPCLSTGFAASTATFKSQADLSELARSQIAHFFEHYKDLEPGKWVKINGWAGVAEAEVEITSGVDRYNSAKKKPMF